MNFDTTVRYFFIGLFIFMAFWLGPPFIKAFRENTKYSGNPLVSYQINSIDIQTAYFEMDGGSRGRWPELKIADEHDFNYKLNLYRIRELNLVGSFFSDFEKHNEIIYIAGQDHFFKSNVRYESSLKILSIQAVFQSRAPLAEVNNELRNPKIYFNHITKKPTKGVIEVDVKSMKYMKNGVVYEYTVSEKDCDYCYIKDIRILN